MKHAIHASVFVSMLGALSACTPETGVCWEDSEPDCSVNVTKEKCGPVRQFKSVADVTAATAFCQSMGYSLTTATDVAGKVKAGESVIFSKPGAAAPAAAITPPTPPTPTPAADAGMPATP